VRSFLLGLLLRVLAARDRLWLRWLQWVHPGLEVHPDASPALAWARYDLAHDARLRIGAGVAAERIRDGVRFELGPGARVEIGEGTWLRCDRQAVVLAAFAGAGMVVGPGCLLNGCHLSAKREIRLGRRVFVGIGSRLLDSDQHDLDEGQPERSAPVVVEDHAWVASDSTVLRGVRVGAHAVVGSRSLVTQDVAHHTLVYGVPARVQGAVGDRSRAR